MCSWFGNLLRWLPGLFYGLIVDASPTQSHRWAFLHLGLYGESESVEGEGGGERDGDDGKGDGDGEGSAGGESGVMSVSFKPVSILSLLPSFLVVTPIVHLIF